MLRKTMKRCWCSAAILAIATLATACSGTPSDEELGPTATLATAPPQSVVTPPTDVNAPTDAYIPTSPPTIVVDDSAAATFWPPVPEGMDPAEFQPDYLTREELTKYQPLPDPDPAAWDIPAEGITPEYAQRVVNYNWNLRSAILTYSTQPDADLTRAQKSSLALYVGEGNDFLARDIDEVAANDPPGTLQRLKVSHIEVDRADSYFVEKGPFLCMTAHVTFQEGTGDEAQTITQWIGLVRDVPPNSLNPSGWRQDAAADPDDDGRASIACERLEDLL